MKRFTGIVLTAALLAIATPAFAQESDASPGIDPSASDSPTQLPAAVVADAQADGSGASASPLPATTFLMGRHYRRLSPTQPTSSGPDQIEVAMLFSYDCAVCQRLEADLLLAYPPSGRTARQRLVRIPAVEGDTGVLRARAYYTAIALGVGDEVHAAMYREIQPGGGTLASEDELRALFTRFNVSAQAFDDVFHSIDITASVRRAANLARRYRTRSVPAVIVNGRFVTNVDMAGGPEAVVRLVAELVARETLRN